MANKKEEKEIRVELSENFIKKFMLKLYELRQDLEKVDVKLSKQLNVFEKEFSKETGIKFSDNEKKKIIDVVKNYR